MKLKQTAKIVTPFAFRKSCAIFVSCLTWCYVSEAIYTSNTKLEMENYL